MFKITEKSVHSRFEYADEDYMITGDFCTAEDGALKEASLNIVKAGDGTPVGYANAYTDGADVKYSINSVALGDMEGATASVKACVGEMGCAS